MTMYRSVDIGAVTHRGVTNRSHNDYADTFDSSDNLVSEGSYDSNSDDSSYHVSLINLII